MAVAGGMVIAVASWARGAAPTEASGPPMFVEDTDAAGVDQVYDGEFQFFVGGGVAVFDCNDDFLPDLFVAGGVEPAGLFVNQSEIGGDLRFERRPLPGDWTAVTGAYPLDVDSDGQIDLAVLRAGENAMLRGRGDCRFEHANEIWRLAGGDDWTVAFSARWDPDQALPTMVFGNYLAGVDQREQCGDHQLFAPAGATYSEAIPLSPGWCTLSALFSDWGRTGEPDLRMTNDRHYYVEGQEQLWHVPVDSTPRLYTSDDGWEEMRIWGMGIAGHDLTGDAMPEYYLTSQGDNKLQTLVDGAVGPTFEDIALDLGVTAHRPILGDVNRPSTAWHAEFGDVNNDGFIDLFVTKGNVDAQADFALDDPNNLLIGQEDGSFLDGTVGAGLLDYGRSRGGSVADLNLDGLLDVVVVERREPVRLWRNTGPGGNWLGVVARQEGPNRNAVGGWVEVRVGNHVMRTEVTVGGGHAGGESGPLHFGLGDAGAADVRVVWPDGAVGAWTRADANQIVLVEPGSNEVTDVPVGD